MMEWTYNDGGRSAAGYKGYANDCACRSIAIAAQQSYRIIYADLNRWAKDLHDRRKRMAPGSAREGVSTEILRAYLASLGWEWTPTMHIGSGCQVHLRDDELPLGRLIVRCSKHITAVIDGVVYDIDDPSRDGSRCVYGYWSLTSPR